MHRFIAIVLLLLVPLRVFGAEAFGITMLEQKAAHAQSMAGMPDDCPMKHGAPDSKDSGDCSGCQMCMSLAGPDAAPASSGGVADSVPAVPMVQFRSAETRRTLRPPIA